MLKTSPEAKMKICHASWVFKNCGVISGQVHVLSAKRLRQAYTRNQQTISLRQTLATAHNNSRCFTLFV